MSALNSCVAHSLVNTTDTNLLFSEIQDNEKNTPAMNYVSLPSQSKTPNIFPSQTKFRNNTHLLLRNQAMDTDSISLPFLNQTMDKITNYSTTLHTQTMKTSSLPSTISNSNSKTISEKKATNSPNLCPSRSLPDSTFAGLSLPNSSTAKSSGLSSDNDGLTPKNYNDETVEEFLIRMRLKRTNMRKKFNVEE